VFKSLTQQLQDGIGASYAPGQSLPESPITIRHVEEDPVIDSGLQFDQRKNEQGIGHAQPQSIFAIASARLQSIKARTPARAKEVAQLITDSQQCLIALDEMFHVLQAERIEFLDKRLEELRGKARTQRRFIIKELQPAVYASLNIINDAERDKMRAELEVSSCQIARRNRRLDRYSTDEQLIAADEAVEAAARVFTAAREKRLEAEKQKAEADNALALGQSLFVALENAMDQCSAELNGVNYHDPATGLSVDPQAHLQ